MKVKVTRKDKQPIVGKKKSLTFVIADSLDKLSKASEKEYCINDEMDDEWSITYQSEEMEKANEMLEIVFEIKDWEKTLNPINIIYWKDDVIDDTKFFLVERL